MRPLGTYGREEGQRIDGEREDGEGGRENKDEKWGEEGEDGEA